MSNPYRPDPPLNNHSLAPWTAPRASLWKRAFVWSAWALGKVLPLWPFDYGTVRGVLARWQQRQRVIPNVSVALHDGDIYLFKDQKFVPEWLNQNTMQCRSCGTSYQRQLASKYWPLRQCYVCLLRNGYTRVETARTLGVSPNTVQREIAIQEAALAINNEATRQWGKMASYQWKGWDEFASLPPPLPGDILVWDERNKSWVGERPMNREVARYDENHVIVYSVKHGHYHMEPPPTYCCQGCDALQWDQQTRLEYHGQ